MTAQKRHYDELLAEHYSWMAGKPYAAVVAEEDVRESEEKERQRLDALADPDTDGFYYR